MTALLTGVPEGFVSLRVNRARAVVRADAADGFEQLLRGGELHRVASRTPGVVRYQGRAPAFGIMLPRSGSRIVVRHVMHGGLLAAITGDRFFMGGRAPYELAVSERLLDLGVATPRFVGYVLYPAGPFFTRCDVATAEIADASDLSVILAHAELVRPALEATARLVVSLSQAGARHLDLNLKNILVTRRTIAPAAVVLDVDRILMQQRPSKALDANLARLARSVRKWRSAKSLAVTDADLEWLSARAWELAT